MVGIFNRSIFNNAIFNTDSGAAQQIGGGGGGPVDYRSYQNRLRRIARAADKRLYRKVEKQVVKLAKTAPAPIAKVAEQIASTIDFAELANSQSQLITVQLNILLKQLDELVSTSIMREIEAEEEMILVMAII